MTARAQIHRHKWHTVTAQGATVTQGYAGAQRVCLTCGAAQVKVSGRWVKA